jgi:tetratricopeptide (TPR) repeat protein
MNAPLSLIAEPPKRLTGREERALLQSALAQRDAPAIRLKLAQLHNRLDEFGDAIALLDRYGAPADFLTAKALIAALMGRGAPGDVERALTAARLAEDLAVDDRSRADAQCDQAAALLRGGDLAQGEQVLESALTLDPANDEAFRRLSGLWLARREADRVLALADELEARGVAHVQLLGQRTKALTMRGDIAAARELVGLDRFLFQATPPAPKGWPDLPSFHAALAQELYDSPGLRNGRHGTASVESLRVDEPATAATPAMRSLQQMIVDYAKQATEGLPAEGHRWLTMRPASAHLRMWCVITEAAGWERWHMHPQGWATGGYYVEVPDQVQRGSGAAGCLEFGLPDQRIGREAAAAFGSRLVRPQPGLLNLFPSHAYHRTHPHGAQGRRICIAFDLIPD